MKKCEMVDSLSKVLQITLLESENIITVLEKLGMQPPINSNWEYVIAPWTIGMPDTGLTIIYKWEQ